MERGKSIADLSEFLCLCRGSGIRREDSFIIKKEKIKKEAATDVAASLVVIYLFPENLVLSGGPALGPG